MVRSQEYAYEADILKVHIIHFANSNTRTFEQKLITLIIYYS